MFKGAMCDIFYFLIFRQKVEEEKSRPHGYSCLTTQEVKTKRDLALA